MTRDVLDHHNSVIDDETGGDRQRHQRQIVNGETCQIHHRKSADQRQRHGHRWNNGGRYIAQEEIDHQHDQHHGHEEFVLDIGDRCPDRHRPIGQHLQACSGRQTRLQLRHQLLNTVDDLNDVGARLTLDIDDDRRLVIYPRSQVGIFGPLVDFG